MTENKAKAEKQIKKYIYSNSFNHVIEVKLKNSEYKTERINNNMPLKAQDNVQNTYIS